MEHHGTSWYLMAWTRLEDQLPLQTSDFFSGAVPCASRNQGVFAAFQQVEIHLGRGHMRSGQKLCDITSCREEKRTVQCTSTIQRVVIRWKIDSQGGPKTILVVVLLGIFYTWSVWDHQRSDYAFGVALQS